MVDETIASVDIDASEAHETLEELDKKAKKIFEKASKKIEIVDQESNESFYEVLQMVKESHEAFKDNELKVKESKEELLDLTLKAQETFDDSKLKIKETEQKVKDLELKAQETFDRIERQSKMSFNRMMTMVRTSYMVITSIVEASGGTISTMFASTIQMAFSMVAILTPLLSARAAAGDYLSAAIGFAEIMASLMAVAAATGQKAEAEEAARDAMSILNSVGALIGSMSFLW